MPTSGKLQWKHAIAFGEGLTENPRCACVCKCALKVACRGLPQMSYVCTQYVTRSRKPFYTCFSRQKPPPSQRHALQKLKRPGRSMSQTNCYTLNNVRPEAKYWSNTNSSSLSLLTSSQLIKMYFSSSVIPKVKTNTSKIWFIPVCSICKITMHDMTLMNNNNKNKQTNKKRVLKLIN